MSGDTIDSSTSDAPSWLDIALIEKALRQGDEADANVRVKSINIHRATAPGDNYASAIYRVKATLADGGEKVLLVKTLPKGDSLANAVEESGLFRYESTMLATHIPTMNAMLNKVSRKTVQPFAARCPLYGSSPEPFLFIEDLKPLGFCLAERHRGLGLRHSLIALRALARMHAASAALLAEDPSVANDFENFFRTGGRTWSPFVTSALQMSADACRKWPGFEEYGEILDRFRPKAMDIVAEINDPKPSNFNTILHGDFWTNNMMFKYAQNGQPEYFRMVDLQLSHVASPAIDLLYFINTSLSDEVFENHERLLIREYHIALTETLDLFGIRGPSFKELMAAMDAHSAYALFGALAVWPVARARAVPDLDASLKGDSSTSTFMYESDMMRRWMQHILPEYKRRGWMNF